MLTNKIRTLILVPKPVRSNCGVTTTNRDLAHAKFFCAWHAAAFFPALGTRLKFFPRLRRSTDVVLFGAIAMTGR